MSKIKYQKKSFEINGFIGLPFLRPLSFSKEITLPIRSAYYGGVVLFGIDLTVFNFGFEFEVVLWR